MGTVYAYGFPRLPISSGGGGAPAQLPWRSFAKRMGDRSSNEPPASTSDVARHGHDIAAQPAAGADGAADEAQPAHRRTHLSHGDRDHGTLSVEGVAPERGGAACAGTTLVRILAEASERGLATSDRTYLAGILNSLSAEGGVAYVRVLDAQRRTFAERTFAESLQTSPSPIFAAAPRSSRGQGRHRRFHDRRPPLHRVADAGGRPALRPTTGSRV